MIKVWKGFGIFSEFFKIGKSIFNEIRMVLVDVGELLMAFDLLWSRFIALRYVHTCVRSFHGWSKRVECTHTVQFVRCPCAYGPQLHAQRENQKKCTVGNTKQTRARSTLARVVSEGVPPPLTLLTKLPWIVEDVFPIWIKPICIYKMKYFHQSSLPSKNGE